MYECNKLGLNATISARTVAHWNNILSANCGKFPQPNQSIFTRNGRTPLLFEYFPESILDFKKLIFGDYNSFTVEWLRHDVICVVNPKCVSKTTDIGETSQEYMLLSKYSHQPLSYYTIRRWVCWMGFEQDSTKKSYYVDGHEKPEQVLHRAQFIKTYLTEIEPRCHRWISRSRRIQGTSTVYWNCNYP